MTQGVVGTMENRLVIYQICCRHAGVIRHGGGARIQEVMAANDFAARKANANDYPGKNLEKSGMRGVRNEYGGYRIY